MDITHLPSHVKVRRFYLYMITGMLSCKIVGAKAMGWSQASMHQNCSNVQTCDKKYDSHQLMLHEDNGARWKTSLCRQSSLTSASSRLTAGHRWATTIRTQNRYSKRWNIALNGPRNGFQCVGVARIWDHHFAQWYNTQHRHSRIKRKADEGVKVGDRFFSASAPGCFEHELLRMDLIMNALVTGRTSSTWPE